MYYTYLVLVLAIFYMDAALLVQAGLFVVQPSAGSECQAGSPCTVLWVDDGRNPLLSAIGVSTVGLYTGRQQLVQTIGPVDVSSTHSITFTPDAAAGPNSDSYYIAIISTTLKGNNSVLYAAFSPYFSLVGMTGSFSMPLPAVTSPIPIPSTFPGSSSTTKLRTITVGTLSTAISKTVVSSTVVKPTPMSAPISTPTETPPSSSPTATSPSISISSPPTTIPSSTLSAPTSSSTQQNSSTSGAGRSASHLPSSLLAVGLVLASSICFMLS